MLSSGDHTFGGPVECESPPVQAEARAPLGSHSLTKTRQPA
jgi:hypothetical protein